MDQLRAMKVFSRVVDEGGFAKAARALDMAPPVVTRVVAELEAHLGARLLNRTTRHIALTEVGEAYLEKVRAILIEIEEAEALASEATTEPRGHLRLLCPPAIAVHQIAKHLPRFRARHPQVTVEIFAPGPVVTVDPSFDLTVLTSRDALTGDFIARRLARTEIVICASPEYLERHGRPQHPRDLAAHEAILPPVSEVQRGLTFFCGAWSDGFNGTDGTDGTDGSHGGDSFTLVPRRAALSTSHIDTMYAATLAGLGVAGLPSYVIEDALMEHALERVLPEWRLFSASLWVAMPTRKHLPARTRVFLDFLLEVFGGEDRDPWLTAAGCETTGL